MRYEPVKKDEKLSIFQLQSCGKCGFIILVTFKTVL